MITLVLVFIVILTCGAAPEAPPYCPPVPETATSFTWVEIFVDSVVTVVVTGGIAVAVRVIEVQGGVCVIAVAGDLRTVIPVRLAQTEI